MSRLPAAAACWVLLVPGLAAQQNDHLREAPTAEGPLDNDVFVPSSEPAAKALAAGDEALDRARKETSTTEAARWLDEACEQWRVALAAGPGASVAGAGMGEARAVEGVRAALLWRLRALAPAEAAHWSTRVDQAARAALDALPAAPPARAEPLAEIVRSHPLTPGATRAALELADLAREAGLGARARAWLARAADELPPGSAPELGAALAARWAALPTPGALTAEAWRTATRIEPADTLVFTPERPGRPRAPAPTERWLTCGGAYFGRRSFVVQTAGELLVLSVATSGKLHLEARIRPGDLLGGFGPESDFEPPHEPPGWPLLPLADERGVVLVVGRTRPEEPNALLAVDLSEPDAEPGLEGLGLELGLGPERARAHLRWAVVGSERVDRAGTESREPALEELGDYEFQPGPVLAADLVVAEARATDGQVRSWLLAFDPRDGRLAWKRLLAVGADRVPAARFSRVQRSVAGQPLLALEPLAARVFAGTHLGLGVLVEAELGEPAWSFKNRRRDEHDPGWNGDRPVLGGEAGAPVVLWAPMDSDRLYALAPRALDARGAQGLLARAPAPALDAQRVLGGDAQEHLVQGSAGQERMLSLRRAGRDRIDALELDQDERFQGLGLASPQRAWVSTNRTLYLFDRTRELYLLDSAPLAPAGVDAPGGDVYAREASVLVVGASALWSFRVR